MMDALTATLLAQATTEVSRARNRIVNYLNGGSTADLAEASATLGEALGTLAGLERRIVEGRV